MEGGPDQGVPVETLGSNCRKDQAAGWMRILRNENSRLFQTPRAIRAILIRPIRILVAAWSRMPMTMPSRNIPSSVIFDSRRWQRS